MDGQQAHVKVFNTTTHSEKCKQNHNEILYHTMAITKQNSKAEEKETLVH